MNSSLACGEWSCSCTCTGCFSLVVAAKRLFLMKIRVVREWDWGSVFWMSWGTCVSSPNGYAAERLDPESTWCWKSSMEWQDCAGVTLLHLMAGCNHPFPSLGETYLPNLHIHKCQRWFCVASARWDGRISAGSSANFRSPGISAGRLHLRLFSHFSGTAKFQHQGQAHDIPPLVWMLSYHVAHPASLQGPSACQVVSNHSF